MGEHFDFHSNLAYVKEKLEHAYRDALEAHNYIDYELHGDLRYQLSLTHMSMSFVSYVELRRFYHEHQLEYDGFGNFFKAYLTFKRQINSAIVNKHPHDAPWLIHGSKDLTKSKKELESFIETTYKKKRIKKDD